MGIHWNQRALIKASSSQYRISGESIWDLCFPSTANASLLHQPAIILLFESCALLYSQHGKTDTSLSKHTYPSTTFPSLYLIFLLYISSNIYGDGLTQGSKFTLLVLHPPSDALCTLTSVPSPLQISSYPWPLSCHNKLHIKMLKTLRWPGSDHPTQILCRTTFRANGDECWTAPPIWLLPKEQGWGML